MRGLGVASGVVLASVWTATIAMEYEPSIWEALLLVVVPALLEVAVAVAVACIEGRNALRVAKAEGRAKVNAARVEGRAKIKAAYLEHHESTEQSEDVS